MSGGLEYLAVCLAKLKEASVELRQDINEVHRLAFRAKGELLPNFVLFVWSPQHTNNSKADFLPFSVRTTIDDDDERLTR